MENLDKEIIGTTAAEHRSSKRKKWTLVTIFVLLTLSMITCFMSPMLPVGFDHYPLHLRLSYLLATYLLPVVLIFPALFLGAVIGVISAKRISFRKRWMKGFRVVFMVLMFANLFLMVSWQVTIHTNYKEFYDSQNYNGKEAYAGDVSDLKTGVFYGNGFKFVRTEETQDMIDSKTGKTMNFKLGWLGNAEYFLLPLNEDSYFDTMYVKIISNHEDYYEYYSSMDRKDAVFGKLYKKKPNE